MKTYNITNRISAQARKELNRIVETHEKFSKSYFFKPSCNAAGRRRSERKFAERNPNVSFIKGNSAISISMEYRETCGNVYYKLFVSIEKDGEKEWKNISLIKKLLK